MEKRKKENDQLQQMSQQIQQLEQQLQESQKQLKKFQEQNQELEKAKLQLEQSKIKIDSDIQWYKAKTERNYKESTVEEQKKRTEVELQQLYDGNPYNDKLRQV